MANSRERILGRLRRNTAPFPDTRPVEGYLPMIPSDYRAGMDLQALFVREAQKAGCDVYQARTQEQAVAKILELVGDETTVSGWDPHLIPLSGLPEALKEAGIARVGHDEATAIGLTGVDAALAATGSIVLLSGSGKFRSPSLVPPVHAAVVNADQIVADLESWWAAQREDGLEAFRQASNAVVVTGPSRTADIALQPVMGMHGPGRLHIILLDQEST